MKRYFSAALAAVLIAGLTACGGGAPQAATTTASATPSPTPTQVSRPVPDVTGKSYSAARSDLSSEGFSITAVGKDGKKWTTVPGDKVTALSTKPAAGTVTDAKDVEITVSMTEAEEAVAVKAAADAAKLAIRYEIHCGMDYSAAKMHSYKEVWASVYYKGGDRCYLDIDGQDMYSKVPLLPQEQAVVDVIEAHGGDVSLPAGAFGTAYLLCAKLDTGYADQMVARMDWKKADALGALSLCPDAPHAAVLQDVATSVKVGEGTHTVGQDMDPGTYKTAPGAKDCYWSRTNGGGSIIANDMVGFAPNGVTVTVYPGEGFESQSCGAWTKIG